MVVVGLEQHRQGIAGLPEQAQACAARAQAGVGAGVRTRYLPEAVPVFAVDGDACRQRVADRQVQCTLQAHVAVVAGLARQVALVAAIDDRVVRADEDRAADGVLAAKRPLRTAQDLDRSNVVVRLLREVTRERRHAITVDDDPRTGLRVVLGLADPTDVEIDTLTEVVHGGRRRRELELIDHVDATVEQVVAGQHRCRDRRRLQRLVSAIRRDRDGFEGGNVPRRRGLLHGLTGFAAGLRWRGLGLHCPAPRQGQKREPQPPRTAVSRNDFHDPHPPKIRPDWSCRHGSACPPGGNWALFPARSQY